MKRKHNLKIFATVESWNPDERPRRMVVDKYGPDFFAKDFDAVQQLINIMGYQVVDILTWVCDVDATDIAGTPVLPIQFDPTLN